MHDFRYLRLPNIDIPTMNAQQSLRPFHLLRWFAGVSALVIALCASALAWMLGDFLTERMFEQEATLTADMVRNVLEADGSLPYFRNPADPVLAERFKATTVHFDRMRDAIRVVVYGRDRRIIWTTDGKLEAGSDDENEELDRAFLGRTVIEGGRISPEMRTKPEHRSIPSNIHYFIETYIPIHVEPNSRPDAVVEVYKMPVALNNAISDGRRQVALGAGICTLALYLSLYGLIRRADRTIRQQQQQLREAETRGLIGEMASAVAHNIRSPLAAIRHAAESNLESPDPLAASSSLSILRDIDQISKRVGEMLQVSQDGANTQARVPLAVLLQSCAQEHADAFAKRRQLLQVSVDDHRDAVAWGDPLLLRQALHSIFTHAGETVGEGGRCHVALLDEGSHWTVRIEDHGAPNASLANPGSAEVSMALGRTPAALFAAKARETLESLPISRRLVELMGGGLEWESLEGRDGAVVVSLPKA